MSVMTDRLSVASVSLCFQPADNFKLPGVFAAVIKHCELLSHGG